MTQQKPPLIILTGPTAVGKTDLSIALAKKINGEIISADSMQVYKYMDIGSAKIRTEDMCGIKHHLIDVLLPSDEFNVFRFQEMAKDALKNIYENGHIPIVTGGTGFYIQALLYNIDFQDEGEHSAIRQQLEETARLQGSAFLHQQLQEIDPDSAEAIHPNNSKRIIRALEFYKMTGNKISEHNHLERQKESAYQSCYFVLNDNRDKLYTQIEQRVDSMLEHGLVDEVKRLMELGYHKNMVSMQGLGYKEILSYLEGECTLDEAIYLIKRDTRHFAKRQLTWFRRERNVIWVNKDDFNYDNDKILAFMIDYFQKAIKD